MTAIPAPPKGTKASGRALWRETLDRFELDSHELAVLREAVRTVDTLDALAETIAAEGLMSVGSSDQPVTHPAVAEARQQRLALARLLASLRLPDDDGETMSRAQHRGAARGAYGPRAVSS